MSTFVHETDLNERLFIGTGETAEQLKLAHDLLHSGGRAVSEIIFFVIPLFHYYKECLVK